MQSIIAKYRSMVHMVAKFNPLDLQQPRVVPARAWQAEKSGKLADQIPVRYPNAAQANTFVVFISNSDLINMTLYQRAPLSGTV
jgi:hypothetical protein